ncbi:hypothetical protein PRIPAC_89217 [Pristionchus pacificus]|nr:hypothetical protein PRIPAC_89217 [Pristionchus pacificus]|eukprot:PDM82135.1 hypothetical protein PRIPAC_36528 [Pristionchus pacificus]
MDTQKMLPKLKEVSTSLCSRRSLFYSEGTFTLDGISIATTSCLLTIVISAAAIYAVPISAAALLPSLFLALLAIWALTVPESCGFMFIYWFNIINCLLIFISNAILFVFSSLVPDVVFVEGFMNASNDKISPEAVEKMLPLARLTLLGLVSLTTFNAYVTVVALKAVCKSRQEPLLPQNPALPLPDWNSSRYYIDRFFAMVNSQLVHRLNLQMEFKSLVKLPTSTRYEGERLDNFEYRKQKEYLAFYMFTADKIPQAKRKHCNSREQSEIQYKHLERETFRLNLHLMAIGQIIRSRTSVYGSEYQECPVFLESIDLPAPSNSLISSANVVECKKAIEFDSTDDEDFDSYAKDILKMAPSSADCVAVSEIESSSQSANFISSDCKQYNTFFESITSFGDSEPAFVALPSSSTEFRADFHCLDAFEKKLERMIEERNQREADRMNGDTFDSVEDVDWEDEYDQMVLDSQLVAEGWSIV